MSEPRFVVTEVPFDWRDLFPVEEHAAIEAMLAANAEERAALDPEVRAVLEEFERDAERRMLFGS